MIQDWLTKAKEIPLQQVAESLGLQVKRNTISECPICGVRKHGSASIIDGRSFYCFRCGKGGDVVDLVAYKLTGSRIQAKDENQHRLVQEWFATKQGTIIEREPPPVRYPPPAELRELLAHCKPSDESEDPMIRSWYRRRHYTSVPAGVLHGGYKGLRWWPRFFVQEFPVIVTAYDFVGTLKTVHGICPKQNRVRKTSWPYGYDASGVLFLDPLRARPWLQKKAPAPESVLFVEGATDYLFACQQAIKEDLNLGIIGIESGSVNALTGINWTGINLFMAMDPDKHAFQDGRCKHRGCPVHEDDDQAKGRCRYAAGALYEKAIVDAVIPKSVRPIRLGDL